MNPHIKKGVNMVQFEYDRRRKRYDVRIPLVVASISEDNKLSLHRELKLEVVRQILMHWDEYEHQMTRELDEMLNNKQKGDK